MSDTPRTDALLAKWHGEWGADALLTLTRELERELHAMTLRCQAADRTANAALAARPEAQARILDEREVKALAKKAGLAKYMWDTAEGRMDLARFAHESALYMNVGGNKQ